MKFCQAYGCDGKATNHGVLCDRHYAMGHYLTKSAVKTLKSLLLHMRSDYTRRAYVEAVNELVATVNRQLTPPAGAVAARPEPKGPAGAFAGSAFSTKPPRNRVEEI